ncbi:MAG TPA: HEAT repeat domain-containing protein, partial [Planctomycetota bacterium]|nr:HEAT repeat domain-containing protein [Planctomycetota bacterium]
TPGGSGPSTPPPVAGTPQGGPNAPQGPSTTGGGDAEPDLTLWSFWWEFNKDPYLDLRSRVRAGATQTGSSDFFLGKNQKDQSKDTLAPTPAQIYDTIVPALLRALETEKANDIVTGCLIALAKIGDKEIAEGGESEFQGVIAKFLADPSQEIRETAAVALGILANPKSVPLLESLLEDGDLGRKAVGSTSVDERTRAYAGYGLALVGYRTSDDEVRKQIVDIFAEMLPVAERLASQDVAVACMIGMGLVPIDAATSEEGSTSASSSRSAQIDFLLGFFQNPANNKYLRAHVPTAVARLLNATEEAGGATRLPQDVYDVYKLKIVEALTEPLDPRKSGFEIELRQSAALALGLVGDLDEDKADVAVRKALMEAVEKDADRQVGKFSMIALGKIGARPGAGEDPVAGRKDVSDHLLAYISKGKSGLDRWAALGIAVMGNAMAENDETLSPGALAAVRDQLAKATAPDDRGAYAIAAGLLKDVESKDILAKQLDATRQEEARGYIALALGLLGDQSAAERIQEIVKESEYKPDLLKQAAIALGLLGDKNLVNDLIDMLKNSNTLATQAALASALGFIGDTRSVDPLVEMLENDTITDTARGFAAVALGIVADKEPLPWNSKIAVDLNYRASTPTLNDQQGTGVLNIL